MSLKKMSNAPKISERLQQHIFEHHKFRSDEISCFRQNLLKHYDSSKRDLPWRNLAKERKDPNERAYAVWVSEIMLQQTQVATVVNYYNRWMKKWPTIPELAKANIEEVDTLWSGLGYYSRGKRLHAAAQEVMNKLNGQVPNTAVDLEKKIPGVGRYTAGAIASIAFNEPTGVVDGNVIRVLCRLRQIGANSASNHVQQLLWDIANSIVCPQRPGDFNQALMELGALICTPKSPKCNKCPLKDICGAYRKCNTNSTDGKTGEDFFTTTNKKKKKMVKTKKENDIPDIEEVLDCCYCLPSESPWQQELGVTNFPRKEKKKPAKDEVFIAVVVMHSGKYLLTKRAEKGLLAGLWEFPLIQLDKENELNKKAMLEKSLQEIEKRFSVELESSKTFHYHGEVAHIFSHLHHTYHVVQLDLPINEKISTSQTINWVSKESMDEVGITKAIHKILAFIDNDKSNEQKSSKRKKTDLKETKSKQRKMNDFFKK